MRTLADRYRQLKTSELLEILASPTLYEPEALTAAQNEVDRRLADQETADITNAEIQSYTEQKKSANPTDFVSTSDRMQSWGWLQKTSGIDRFIMLTSIYYILSGCYNVVRQWDYIVFMFSDDTSRIGSFDIIYPLHIVVVFAGGILFWKRNRIGWMLLTGYQLYSLAVNLFFVYQFLNSHDGNSNGQFSFAYGIPVLLHTLYSAGWIWLLSRARVRETFEIHQRHVMTVVCISCAAALVFMGALSGVLG